MTPASTARWRRAVNLSADALGSIHDDNQAKALGFRAALIGGSITCAFAVERLVDRFGREWYERGFLKQAFISPLFEVDDFQVLLEPLDPHPGDDALVSVALEKRDGTRVTAGYAGLVSDPNAAVPPWRRDGEDGSAPSARDPLPEVRVGTAYVPYQRTVTLEESESRRSMVGDDNPWYTESSPWGGPIMPSFMYMLIGGGGAPKGGFQARPEMRAGMNGTFQLLQFAPLLIGGEYTIAGHLAEKGFSSRTAYRTNEFVVTSNAGERVAVARQKIRWMAEHPD